MELYKKEKPFPLFPLQFSKSRFSFDNFQKKDDLHS